METADDEFHFLVLSVERAVDVQERAARQLLEVSGGSGVVLAERLLAHYGRVRELVGYSRESFEESDDAKLKQGAITQMRTLVGYAREDLQRCLAWLDAAADPVLDLGSRYLIEFLASHLVDTGSEVTVVTTPEGSYSTMMGALLEDPDADDENDHDGAIPIVIFIPRREQHSGLLHPLIVHELAHAASRRHGLARKLVEMAEVSEEISKEHAAAAQAIAAHMEVDSGIRKYICEALEIDAIDPNDSQALTDAAGDYLWTIAQSCLEEAFCDAFAVQILGPTYLYAFAAIVGTSDLDDVDPQHPAARQRVGLMLSQLDQLGWTDLMKEETPDIFDWFAAQAGVASPKTEPAPLFSAATVTAMTAEVHAIAAEHIGDLTFTPEAFDSTLRGEVRHLLEEGLPPAQLQSPGSTERTDEDGTTITEEIVALKPIDRSQIILGSWLFAIRESGGTLRGIAKAPGLPELSLLLPKALELSALLCGWFNEVPET